MQQRVMFVVTALAMFIAVPLIAADHPSRPPVKGCQWQKLSDASLGLEAWVQHCDFGFRKIDFNVAKSSLRVRYSDGGDPDPVIDVLPLLKGEGAEAGVKRIFAAHTDPVIAKRCVLAPYREGVPRAGVKRYTFVPNAAYQKELNAKADPDEVGDPPCGDWGSAPDGIQYFETQGGADVRRVLFVRVGQDEPLFDENTLRILPQPGGAK
jgi:hypothetical protein